jgi:hypothetical protein
VTRYHRPILVGVLLVLLFHRLAVLLGAQAREAGSSAHALDGAAAHEAVDVDACARPLRGHADDCVRQLGGVRMLVVVGTTVLPDVPGPEPNPNDAAHAAAARSGHRGGPLHRVRDRPRRRHVHRRYGHAHDRLRGPPVRRDRPEGIHSGRSASPRRVSSRSARTSRSRLARCSSPRYRTRMSRASRARWSRR